MDSEQYQKAHALTDQLLANGHDNSVVHYLRGLAEIKLERCAQAKASLEKALEREPGEPTIREAIAYVSAMLGEGDNSGIKKEISPVPLPPELRRSWQAEFPPSRLEGQNAYYLGWATAIEFVPGERLATTKYRSIKILDTTGVDQFNTLLVDFHPLSEEIHVNHLAVFDAEGAPIARGNVSDLLRRGFARFTDGDQRQDAEHPSARSEARVPDRVDRDATSTRGAQGASVRNAVNVG